MKKDLQTGNLENQASELSCAATDTAVTSVSKELSSMKSLQLPISSDISPGNQDWAQLLSEAEAFPSELQTPSVPLYWCSTPPENAMLPLLGDKKRGRKLNRPNDPIRKKTEEKDKYWLRAFRAYMKTHFVQVRKTMTAEDRFFWRDYLSPEGKPEKGNRFSSFGRQYKNALFSNESFVRYFQDWFCTFGEKELLKKCPRDTPLWTVLYYYAAEELLRYNPNYSENSIVASPVVYPPLKLQVPHPPSPLPVEADTEAEIDLFLDSS